MKLLPILLGSSFCSKISEIERCVLLESSKQDRLFGDKQLQTPHPKQASIQSPSDNQSFPVLNLEFSDKPENWMIIAFSSSSTIPQSKIWYNQLENIGYKNHYLVAFDSSSYKTLSESKSQKYKQFFRVMNSTRYLTRMRGLHEDILKMREKIKFETVKKLVEEGKNVFLSDVQTIWLKYSSLDSLPRNMDVFQSKEKTCFLFRSNQNSINFLENMNVFKFEFIQPPGLGSWIGVQKSGPKLKIMQFSTEIIEEHGKPRICHKPWKEEDLWIVRPESYDFAEWTKCMPHNKEIFKQLELSKYSIK